MDSRDQTALEVIRQAADDAALEHLGRSLGDLGSGHVAVSIFEALKTAGFAVMPTPEPPKRHACVSCGTVLAPVFETAKETFQYDDALEIRLCGGYGMFFDNIDGDHHVFLCGVCARIVCGALPWFAKVLGRTAGGQEKPR